MRNALQSAIVAGALLTATSVAHAEEEEPRCGMLPPDVAEDNFYAGFGSCALKEAKEQPLWKGLKSEKLVRQSRFTFVDGHVRWIWTIRIDERTNGKGRVEVTRIAQRKKSLSRREVKRHWHRNISREKMAKFNALTTEAGIWKFENGTWDDQEQLYLHCITLDMEQVSAEGFRYSGVNISCNRPRKLKAPIEHVLAMAELDWDDIYN